MDISDEEGKKSGEDEEDDGELAARRAAIRERYVALLLALGCCSFHCCVASWDVPVLIWAQM